MGESAIWERYEKLASTMASKMTLDEVTKFFADIALETLQWDLRFGSNASFMEKKPSHKEYFEYQTKLTLALMIMDEKMKDKEKIKEAIEDTTLYDYEMMWLSKK